MEEAESASGKSCMDCTGTSVSNSAGFLLAQSQYLPELGHCVGTAEEMQGHLSGKVEQCFGIRQAFKLFDLLYIA